MRRANLVGDFLRARRAQLSPEEAGLPARAGRRVSGLRREEVALLAGVSSDYYTRLEQGRSLPSVQVAQALAHALQLDAAATNYLHQLVSRVPEEGEIDPTESQRSDSRLQTLLDQWPTTPAWVSDRYADVHAANALATAVNPACTTGNNMLRSLFRDEAAMREVYVDFDRVAAAAVASLRARNGVDVDDRRLSEMISELSNESALFARLWSRHDVRFATEVLGIIRLQHPVAGPLEFHTDSMIVVGNVGTVLNVYYADPGSATERNIRQLLTTPPR
jgi:transcriptional regulator with XRE-family HTH domain